MKTIFLRGGALLGAIMLFLSAGQAGAQDWSGFHAGVSFGLAAANTIATPPLPMPSGETLLGNSQTGSSFSFGANAGYDKQINSLVIGIYGEVDYLHIATNGFFSEGGDDSTWGTQTGDLLGSARVRLGGASDNVMIYGSGGLAFVHSGIVGWNYEDQGPLDFANNSLGYVFGGGVEYRLNQKVSVNLDYSHYFFSGSNSAQEFSDEFSQAQFGSTNRTGIDVMKVGLNYRF